MCLVLIFFVNHVVNFVNCCVCVVVCCCVDDNVLFNCVHHCSHCVWVLMSVSTVSPIVWEGLMSVMIMVMSPISCVVTCCVLSVCCQCVVSFVLSVLCC